MGLSLKEPSGCKRELWTCLQESPHISAFLWVLRTLTMNHHIKAVNDWVFRHLCEPTNPRSFFLFTDKKKLQLFKLYHSHWSDQAACVVGWSDILVIRCFGLFTGNMWFFFCKFNFSPLFFQMYAVPMCMPSPFCACMELFEHAHIPPPHPPLPHCPWTLPW